MKAKDEKKLPAVRKLQHRLMSVLVDMHASVGTVSSLGETELRSLSDRLDVEFSLRSGAAWPILDSVRGVPYTVEASQILAMQLERWIPALRAGYKYAPVAGRDLSLIPHVARIVEPVFDPDAGRWSVGMELLDGPLQGTQSRLLLQHRMACLLVTRAVGLRVSYSLGRPRPYDLHRMTVLIRTTPVGSSTGIHQILTCAAMVRANKEYRGRFGHCSNETYKARLAPRSGRHDDILCFDCGLGTDQCPLARHDSPQTVGECRCCGQRRVTTSKGVCLICLDNATTTGSPLSPMRRASQAHPA